MNLKSKRRSVRSPKATASLFDQDSNIIDVSLPNQLQMRSKKNLSKL